MPAAAPPHITAPPALAGALLRPKLEILSRARFVTHNQGMPMGIVRVTRWRDANSAI
jgi:hypothetical protein